MALMIIEHVQAHANAFCDNNEKTVYNVWNFLESTYTGSCEQAIQIILAERNSPV